MINLQKQKGMMLFIVMLILPLLLVLGSLLMGNTFLGLKVVDSRVMKVESNMILEGAARDILNATDSPQVFAAVLDSATTLKSDLFKDVTTMVDLNGESNCKRRMNASGTNNFKCKYLQVNLNHRYGRETGEKTDAGDNITWAVNSMGQGIEQPLINN